MIQKKLINNHPFKKFENIIVQAYTIVKGYKQKNIIFTQISIEKRRKRRGDLRKVKILRPGNKNLIISKVEGLKGIS